MHPTEVKLIEIGKRYALFALQIAKTYNDRQAELQLDLVLSQTRLETTEGTKASLDVLSHLDKLTNAHKAAFTKYVGSSAAEFALALAEMPADLQEKHRAGLLDSVNRQLEIQSEFYVNRKRWIKAAVDICNLIESNRATSTFSEGGVTFADPADHAQLEGLLAIVEETHRFEMELLEKRLACIAASASVFSLGPQK